MWHIDSILAGCLKPGQDIDYDEMSNSLYSDSKQHYEVLPGDFTCNICICVGCGSFGYGHMGTWVGSYSRGKVALSGSMKICEVDDKRIFVTFSRIISFSAS